MKKLLNKIINKKYLAVFTLCVILIVASSLRFYKIREYLTFLGDEGRDVLVVKRMIVDHKFTLLGPITSVGTIYMGPVYYYFMAPFLWAWRLDPVGPAIMVAIFAIATVFLLYKTGAEFFHPILGLTAALLYSTSPLTIAYGRSSWNPNIVPFFSLLTLYSLLKVIIRSQYWWLIVAGLSLGILLQLHYVTLILLPIVLFCLVVARFRIPAKYYFYSLFGLILSYSPFLLFEFRHQFVNSNAIWRFLTQQQNNSGFDILAITNTMSDTLVRLFWRLIIIESAQLSKFFIIGSTLIFIFYLSKIKKDKKIYAALKIILIWLLVGISTYGLYRGVIYDYYFGSLFALPFLVTGFIFYLLWQNLKFGKLITLLIIVLLLFFHLRNSPFRIPPNNMLNNTKTIAAFVSEKTEGTPYNFALLAPRNSDHAYRYFLEIWGHPPAVIENEVVDPQRKSVTEQLLVVCEEKVCQPLGHPLWEIAGFGRAEIIGEWDVVTTKVFRLKHFTGSL